MWKMMAIVTMVLAISGAASTVQADAAAGDACAARLNQDGKAIYTAVVTAKPTAQNLRDVVEEQTRSLARNDKISRGTARDNARAAFQCMEARLN